MHAYIHSHAPPSQTKRSNCKQVWPIDSAKTSGHHSSCTSSPQEGSPTQAEGQTSENSIRDSSSGCHVQTTPLPSYHIHWEHLCVSRYFYILLSLSSPLSLFLSHSLSLPTSPHTWTYTCTHTPVIALVDQTLTLSTPLNHTLGMSLPPWGPSGQGTTPTCKPNIDWNRCVIPNVTCSRKLSCLRVG